jgi:hypothetical protein
MESSDHKPPASSNRSAEIPASDADPYALDERQIPCPNCGVMQPDTAVICISCGHDRLSGETLEIDHSQKTRRDRQRKRKAGRMRSRQSRRTQEEMRRERWLHERAVRGIAKSLFMIALGPVIVGVGLGMMGGEKYIPEALGLLIPLVACGVFSFIVCAFWWIGFGRSKLYEVLRWAGIFSVSLAPLVLSIAIAQMFAEAVEPSLIGSGLFGFRSVRIFLSLGLGVTLLLYISFAAVDSDIDTRDAMWVLAGAVIPLVVVFGIAWPNIQLYINS